MKRLIIIVLSVAVAGPASATVGSIIGSFLLPHQPQSEIPLAIYRDPDWVYAVYYLYPGYELRRYTPTGSFGSSVSLPTTQGFSDASHCHLGRPYFGLVNSHERYLYFIRKATGVAVASFAVTGAGGYYPDTVFWDGGKYYVGNRSRENLFNMYTPAGSLIGSWEAVGWPSTMYTNAASAFSRSALKRRGRFLIASSASVGQPSCIIDMDTGSLLATWYMGDHSRAYGSVVGDAYPPSFGAAYWVNWADGGFWATQVDIDARGAANVLPASIGKIKAIYR